MTTENPTFVDPREFLSLAGGKLESASLAKEPTVDLIRWATTLKFETGFVYRDPYFFVVRGYEGGVSGSLMPHLADILLHTHPNEDVTQPDFYPSLLDFLNSSTTAVNLVASKEGVTQHWAPNDEELVELKKYWYSNEYKNRTDSSYHQMLKSLKVKFQLHPWEEIADRYLSTIFLNAPLS